MRGLDGVNPTLALYVRQADQIIRQAAPGLSLVVVSGYRDPAHQAQLLARWNAGDRTGLVAKPALRSKHSEGLAVDLAFVWRGSTVPVRDTPREYWQYLADLFAPVGVRWGGTFRSPDINHFDITIQRT